METLLVTKQDFAAYADLPESLDMSRLTPHILAVQRTRLKPILTEPLAAELARRVAAATVQAPLADAWAKLLAEVVPVVCCAAMARYTPFSPTTQTASGLRIKESQYSQPADGREVARQASVYDGDVLSFEVALQKWLTTNAALFAGYYPQTTCCGGNQPSRTPTVVVQAIRPPADRYDTPWNCRKP